MDLVWKLNRLRSMSVRELGYRARQAALGRVQKAGVGLARNVAPGTGVSRAWRTPLPRGFDVHAYIEAANRILDGQYSIFSMHAIPLGFPPRWNQDPRTGTLVPNLFGKSLDYRDERLVGNIKYLWEVNRHLELVTLAQAWHLTGEARFLAGCRRALESWFDQCPYMRGPNWTSSLELAIRLTNWSFAWQLLGGEANPMLSGTEGAAFRTRWLRSIYQHCHFIAGHFSRFSSANNHLLGELLGLIVAGRTWPLWPDLIRWRDRAFEEFEREVLRQTATDGVGREQGIWYHHEVIDMMLIAWLVSRANGVDVGPEFKARLERMLEFVASLMDVGGHVPAFGDSDDAVMVRFSPAMGRDVYRSLLCTGAVLFRRGDFKRKAGRFDDKSRWLLGDEAADDFERIPPAIDEALPRWAFDEGGYYVLGSDFERPEEVRIVADAGPLGYLSIAAHGHADALSFTLSVGGREVLIDPGTYAYHTERAWRDYFRGTSAHNTITVDRQGQSVSGGTFLWTRHARARCESYSVSAREQRLVASHDGYSRLRDPVIHRREIVYEPLSRTLRVQDELACSAHHWIELHWHFAGSCRVDMGDRAATVDCDGVIVSISWPDGLEARVVSGRESPPLGWVSTQFDSKQPSNTMVVEGRIDGNWKGVSEIHILEIGQ